MKYRNLIITLFLIVVWSLFFAVYKYFMWGIFKDDTITLQYISAYLSIGTIGSFIVWWLLYELVGEKKYHIAIGILAILTMCIVLFLPWADNMALLVAGITVLLGFFYGLWGVLRNILVASQIQETGIGENTVNGLANIFFITSLILGTIGGWWLAGHLAIAGVYVIIGLLACGVMGGVFFTAKYQNKERSSSEKIQEYKREFLGDFLFIFQKYWMIMIFVSIIITIGTILSQVAIAYFVDERQMSEATAGVILLYSAVGAIVWNVVSMKVKRAKWEYFFGFMICFALSCGALPFVFKVGFVATGIVAGIAGAFFGVSYNLMESYFFKKIGDDDKKSYGAVSIGIVTAVTIAVMMFGVDVVQNIAGSTGVYLTLAGIILAMGTLTFINKNTLT